MAGRTVEHVVIVTRTTELDDLVARFNTRAQAEFYLQQAGQPFEPIEIAHARQQQLLESVRRAIPASVKVQVIDRETIPRYQFGEDDLVIAIGQDGLVSNTAKYLRGQPILAINPDPSRFDGVLLPFAQDTFAGTLRSALARSCRTEKVTLALAELEDGQTLLAFNDFFIGASTHVSARYNIAIGERREEQSSSGIIVSTGAGSTGWLQSVYAGAAGVIEAFGGRVVPPPAGGRLPWDSDRLVYSVREPFPSVATQASIVHGSFDNATPLVVESKMTANGVIFSDGVEADYLAFNSGAQLRITTAPTGAALIVPDDFKPIQAASVL